MGNNIIMEQQHRQNISTFQYINNQTTQIQPQILIIVQTLDQMLINMEIMLH